MPGKGPESGVQQWNGSDQNRKDDRTDAGEGPAGSEARLKLALEAARMGTWTLDPATGIHTRDANLNRLLGLDPEETAQPFDEFLAHTHPDDRQVVRDAFDRMGREGWPLNVEFRVVRPDGSVRWLRDQGDVFGDTDPGSRRMAGVCVDVTERKEAESRVRASEEWVRLILESATDFAILTQAPDRTVTSWSPGAAAAFGYADGEVVGRPVDVLFTPEDREDGSPEDEARVALRDGRAADERWHMRKDGSRFYASGVLTPLGEGGSLGYVKVLRDLTGRKQMEDDLRRARDELELRVAERTADLRAEIARRKDLSRRLATAQEDERRRVSRDLHDSIGQLLAVLPIAFRAVKEAGDLPAAAAARLSEAQHLADAVSREVHALAVRLRPTALDDLGLVAALELLVAEWSARAGVPADFQAAELVPGRLPPEVETTIYRVVQEALTNAAKHARAGRVSVVVARSPGAVSAVVEDDGAGFDPAEVSKGRLGLVGMRERAAMVGGELEVESGPGKGTVVLVRVPTLGDGGT